MLTSTHLTATRLVRLSLRGGGRKVHDAYRPGAAPPTVGREQLQLLRASIRWKSVASAFLDLAFVGCAALDDRLLYGLMWFVAVTALQRERDRRLLLSIDAQERGRPSARSVGQLAIYFVSCSALHVLMAGPLLLSGNAQVRMVATLLVVGGSAGVVVLCAGSLRAYLAWTLPLSLLTTSAWMWQGGWSDLGVALLVPIFVSVLGLTVVWHRQMLVRAVKTARRSRTRALALQHERDLARRDLNQRAQGIAAAGHDLRQPLHALSCQAAALRLLNVQDPRASVDQLACGINRAVSQSLRLVETLLETAREEIATPQANPSTIDLAAWCQDVIDDHQARAVRQGIALRLCLFVNGQALVRTDPFLLRRVVGNLLDNAIKFTSVGHVELCLQPGTAPGQWDIAVEDTGCGLRNADLEQAPDRHPHAGYGWGLAIARGLALALGSELQVRSDPGHGSRFGLSISDLPGITSPLESLTVQTERLGWVCPQRTCDPSGSVLRGDRLPARP